jgi:hypothetical protein
VAIGPSSRSAAGVERADVRLREHPASDPQDREILADLIGLPAVSRAHLQDADVECTGAAGQLAAHIDALRLSARVPADAAGEERRHHTPGHASEIEVARSFQKEIALLFEEQRKTREVDAPLVDLGLGEVGVDAEIQLECGGDIEECVEPDIAVGNSGRLTGGRRRRQVRNGIGFLFEAEPLRDVRQSVEAPGT